MKIPPTFFALPSSAPIAGGAIAAEPPLKFGVGLFQPDRDKNDATYRPLVEYLSTKLKRPAELRTVERWEGLAKSLANGETDIARTRPLPHPPGNRLKGPFAP
jgi:phosphonate transport system substrate-binding protein